MSRAVQLPAETEEWGSPIELFQALHGLHEFTVDLAASAENALLPRYYTRGDDALAHEWSGERAYCNPPYDHRSLYLFARKAAETWCHERAEGYGVFLLPAKTDQDWWHEFVWKGVSSRRFVLVRFLLGRQKYQRPGKCAGAGFSSVLVTFGRAGR